jgi:hypothetical protein
LKIKTYKGEGIMKLYKLSIFFISWFLFCDVNAQVVYKDINSVATITNLAYDDTLGGALRRRASPFAGVSIFAVPNSSPLADFPMTILTANLDTFFQCGDSTTNKVAFVSAFVGGNFLRATYKNLIEDLAIAAFSHGYKIKLGKIVCGFHPDNTNEKIMYVLEPKDFQVIPGLGGQSTSSWINGVIVADGSGVAPGSVSTNWGFEISTAGNYEIYAHWVANKNTVTNISYAFDGEGAVFANLDQNISSGIWVKLGVSKAFSVGSHSVNISVDPTAFYVVDGIKVERAQ